MGWREYCAIFQGYLPAADFEEGVYFLPRALAYLRDNPEDAFECQGGVLIWISEYSPYLARVGLLDDVRRAVHECVRVWTATFEIKHFNRAACAAMGWGLAYDDLVRNSDNVCSLICDLVRLQTEQSLIEEIVAERCREEATAIESAWFLEIAAQAHGPIHELKQCAARDILFDKNLLVRAAVRVQHERDLFSSSPTYWAGLVGSLGLQTILSSESPT